MPTTTWDSLTTPKAEQPAYGPWSKLVEPEPVQRPTNPATEIRPDPETPRQQLSPAARDASDTGRFAPPQVVPAEQVRAERKQAAINADIAARRNTWAGRFEERLAKTALGQTALRVEQGFGDIARGVVQLGAQAAGADTVSSNIHREKQARQQWLDQIEKGGDIETLLTPTGSKIYSGVVSSLSQMGPAGKLAGTAGVYGTIGGLTYTDGLEEAREIGLSGGQDAVYAGKKAVWELGVTHLMGQVGKKFGLESLEESLSPGLRNAAAKIGQRVGIRDKLTQLAKATGGAGLEAIEEAIVDAGQQAIERGETGGKFDWERLLLAGATGAAARGATGTVRAITQSLGSAKNYAEQTIAGAIAAEKALQAEGGDILARSIAAKRPTASLNIEGTDKGGALHIQSPQGDTVGDIRFTFIRGTDDVRIQYVDDLPSDFRGQGIGTDAYKKIIEHAAAQGKKRLLSDNLVTPDAARVYARLAEAGYAVTRHPMTEFDPDAGSFEAAGRPVFTVNLKRGTPQSRDNPIRKFIEENEQPATSLEDFLGEIASSAAKQPAPKRRKAGGKKRDTEAARRKRAEQERAAEETLGAIDEALGLSAKEFAEATGIKRAKPAFRESFLDTVRLYAPAPIGPGSQTTVSETLPVTEQIDVTAPRGTIKISDVTFPGEDDRDIHVAEVRNAAGDRIGSITFSDRGDALRIETAGIDKVQTGETEVGKGGVERFVRQRSGAGTPAYEQLVRHAASQGKNLTSDRSTTQEAIDVWNALAARGYKVTQNPNARVEPYTSEKRPDGVRMYTEDDTPVFTLDTSVLPTAPATTTEIVAPMQLVSEQRADARQPPPPAVHDAAAWDDSGYMIVPEKEIGQGIDEIMRHARDAGEALRHIHLSIADELISQGKRAPAHMQPKALGMAEQLKQIGDDVIFTERMLARNIGVEHDKLAKAAGSPAFMAAAIEAQQDGRTFTTQNGATGIEAKIVGAVEGKNPAPLKSKRLRNWIDGLVPYMDKRGKLAERLKVRRAVPKERLAARLAELGAMSDPDMEAHFKELLPADSVPKHRAQLIEKLQAVEFFQNPGGNVWVRQQLPAMQRILSLGEGDPRYADFAEIVAEWNSVPVEAVKRDLNTMRASHEKKAAVEFSRVYPNMPTAMIDRNGDRHELFEVNPFKHLERDHAAFTKRLANLRVIGDQWTNVNREPPVDRLSNEAKAVGLDPTTVDAYLNGLAGHSLTKSLGTDQGGERAANGNIFSAILATTLAGKMTLSGATTALETFGNVRAWGGTGRLLRAWAMQLKRDPRAAQTELIRAGVLAKEYANWTLDATRPVSSGIGLVGEALLSATRPVWNQQSKDAGLVGRIMADDFKNGRASSWDRDTLHRYLGFTKDEADALYNRTASPAAYEELAQRFAARTIAGKLTNPTEESRIRGSALFRTLFPLTRFTLQKGRDLLQLAQNLKADHVEAIATGGVEANLRQARGWLEMGNYFGGLALGGAFANVVRSMFYYGFEEGLGLEKERWETAPVWSFTESLLSGSLGFLLGNLYWGASRSDEELGLLEMSGSATASTVGEMFSFAYSALVAHPTGQLGKGRYTKLDGPVDMAAAYLQATVPAARAANTGASTLRDLVPIARIMLPAALGAQDRKLDAARIAMFRFLDDHDRGPGSGRVGGVDDGTAEFIRQMNNFSREVRKNEPLDGDRLDRSLGYLEAAIGTNTKDAGAIAQSIRARKALRLFPSDGILEAEFAEKFPHHYDKLIAHDYVLDAWADFVKPRK